MDIKNVIDLTCSAYIDEAGRRNLATQENGIFKTHEGMNIDREKDMPDNVLIIEGENLVPLTADEVSLIDKQMNDKLKRETAEFVESDKETRDSEEIYPFGKS